LRAADGLALSSRNNYLSASERAEACQLSIMLQSMASSLRQGETDLSALEDRILATLSDRGWRPDYMSVRLRGNLQIPYNAELATLVANEGLVVLGAARIGNTRLIDNIEI
jgi:pantoate--beta-alanine ligase